MPEALDEKERNFAENKDDIAGDAPPAQTLVSVNTFFKQRQENDAEVDVESPSIASPTSPTM